MCLIMDHENSLALVSLYHFSPKIDDKINLKKSVLVGVNPEVASFRNPVRPDQAILSLLLLNPRDVYVDGAELQQFCVQTTLHMRPSQ